MDEMTLELANDTIIDYLKISQYLSKDLISRVSDITQTFLTKQTDAKLEFIANFNSLFGFGFSIM